VLSGERNEWKERSYL